MLSRFCGQGRSRSSPARLRPARTPGRSGLRLLSAPGDSNPPCRGQRALQALSCCRAARSGSSAPGVSAEQCGGSSPRLLSPLMHRDTIRLLPCQGVFLAPAQPVPYQHPQGFPCQAAFQLGGPAHPAVGLLLPRALRCVGLHEVPVTPHPPGCLCRAEQASSWSVQKDTDPHGITWMGHIIFLVIWPGGGQGELQTVVDPCMLLVCAGALSTVSLEPQLMWLLLPRPWVSESPNPQFVFPVHPQRH